MRALTAGERRASVGAVAGLVGVLCLLISTLALTLSYRAQLINLKQTIAEHCEERRQHQLAEKRLRLAQIREWSAFGSMDDLRADGYRAMAEAAEEAIATAPSRPCSEYLAQLAK